MNLMSITNILKNRVVQVLLLLIIVLGFVSYKVFLGQPSPYTIEVHDEEKIRSLAYVAWSKSPVDEALMGVVKYDRDRVLGGYNVYCDDERRAYLMDMDGNIVHTWYFPSIQGNWQYVELLGAGKIIGVCMGRGFAILDKNSAVIMRGKFPAHHDVEILPDGSFLFPINYLVPYNKRTVFFDSVVHISAKGKLLSEWSTSKRLKDLRKLHPTHQLDVPLSDDALIKADQEEKWPHYYHLNTVEVLPETPLGLKDRRFKKGNIMVCLRNVDLVVILDKKSKKVVWSWGTGILDWPHMPTMLDNGNILIYDNGPHRLYSRVIELDPVKEKIIWSYRADPPGAFFSDRSGSCQRLANGNTLIAESEKGRVFEVTKGGRIVWEFYNPEILFGKRKCIYRMMRVPVEDVEHWL